MDNRSRIKALILLGINMMSLSGCSAKEIKNFLSDKYKIIQEYYDTEDAPYYLVRVEKSFTENKNLRIVGSFETIEEAEEYLNNLINEDNYSLDINHVLYIVCISGIFYYCVHKTAKDSKEFKKLKK